MFSSTRVIGGLQWRRTTTQPRATIVDNARFVNRHVADDESRESLKAATGFVVFN
jgi:hypothetical protein